jgi:hypothetical protein
MFLTSLYRADLLAMRGRAADAVALLDQLKGDPLVIDRPYLLVEIESDRLCCLTMLPDADLVAPAAEARGESELAQRAYCEALRVAARIHRDWKEPTTRERFAKSQAQLLDQARAFSERHGLTEEAEALGSLFAPAQEVKQQRFAEQEKRNDRHRSVGVWLALATIVAGGFVTAQLRPGDFTGLPAAISAALAMLNSVAAMAFSGFLWLLGLWMPRVRRSGGWMVWLLVVLGWVAGLGIYFFVDWDAINWPGSRTR